MTNLEFWTSIAEIVGNDFNSKGTKQLERYAQQFITGRLLFARYTDNEQSGCAAGGTIHVIASILAGAETPADQLTAPEGSFKREQQRAKAQTTIMQVRTYTPLREHRCGLRPYHFFSIKCRKRYVHYTNGPSSGNMISSLTSSGCCRNMQ